MKINRELYRRIPRLVGVFLIQIALLCSCAELPIIPGPHPSPPPQVQHDAPENFSIHIPDGGANYYSSFNPTLSSDPDYFPIGVWLESLREPADRERDRSILINTYIDLVPGFDLQLLGSDAFALTGDGHSMANGYVTTDEVDMWAGPGWGLHQGTSPTDSDICVIKDEHCGFSVLQELVNRFPRKALLYANFGKGVTFWNSDSDSSDFLSSFVDIVSADNYWFTDPNICSENEGGQMLDQPRDLSNAECRLAANYGWTIRRLRELVEPAASKPVWAFIEVGQPFTDGKTPAIEVEEIRAAVWSSLINNARGIIYFNHSFSGDCASQHVLRDCDDELRDGVRGINQQIKKLAPILNSNYVKGAIENDGKIQTSTRLHRGKIYVFAGSLADINQNVNFSIQCVKDATIEVIDENRTIEMSDGKFKDYFAGPNDVHLYEIGENVC